MPKQFGTRLLDLMFPALCPNCSEVVGQAGAFCATCWSKLNFISDPKCFQCGYPFDFDNVPEMKCANCLTHPPEFDRGISVLQYDDHSKKAILAFKHADRTDLAPSFAKWLKRAGQEILTADAVLCPVPLHKSRLRGRRYNQSAMLAQCLAKESGLKFTSDLLLRTRNTDTQGGKNLDARHRNVKNAFKINPKRVSDAATKHVILIDDVYTTGATLNACAICLRKANVSTVSVLTLSRVVRTQTLPI